MGAPGGPDDERLTGAGGDAPARAVDRATRPADGRAVDRRGPRRRALRPCVQSEDLTGSGFNVPGSQSDSVRQVVQRDFPESRRGADGRRPGRPAPGAAPGALEAAVARGGPRPARGRGGGGRPRRGAVVAGRGAPRRPASPSSALRVGVGEDRAPEVASELRETLDAGDGPPGRGRPRDRAQRLHRRDRRRPRGRPAQPPSS